MSEIAKLVNQVKQAADKIVERIQEIDGEILQLDNARAGLENAPISKNDLMEYVREDIKRRGTFYTSRLRMKWARDGRHIDYGHHEQVFKDGGIQGIPYLDGEVANSGVAFRPDAFYWLFGDLIAARFEKALDTIKWPEPGLPLNERRIKIQEIDAKIEALTEERDRLAGELSKAMPVS